MNCVFVCPLHGSVFLTVALNPVTATMRNSALALRARICVRTYIGLNRIAEPFFIVLGFQ